MTPRSSALLIVVDGGTTRTRAWAVRDGAVLGQAAAMIGARDTARDGSPARLEASVQALCEEVVAQAGESSRPAAIVGAGMITSAEGLHEVPHVEAPADAARLAAGARCATLPGFDDVPFWLLPGVRSGPAVATPQDIGASDVMRGEETLAVGVRARGRLADGGTLLSLGSHWKAVRVDGAGQVLGSTSTLSGELLLAIQRETILASALPRERPAVLAPTWVDAGAAAARAAGLARALYCVRLLDQRAPSGPDERYAFLVGAAIASDQAALCAGTNRRILIVGAAPALASAWQRVLQQDGREAAVLDPGETEEAFRAGCLAVLRAAAPELSS